MNAREVEILGILYETPSHVYRLEQILAARHDVQRSDDLYRVIKSLERRGLVRHSSTLSGKGPERKIYSLTTEGEDLLSAITRAGATLLLGECLGEIAEQILMHFTDEENLGPVRRVLLVLSPISAKEREIFAALGKKIGKRARERYVLEPTEGPCLDGYTPVCGDATEIPFDDETFDLVLGPGLSAGDITATIGECARVLVPGGTLVTIQPFSRESVEQSLLAAALVRQVSRQFPHLAPRSHLEFIRALDQKFSVACIPHRGSSAFICRKDTA
ncbi:MAG: helix-turn-helix transcriptional regulator [Methanomicrobiales archaeon]|nr:helix-turn-helix transcriptional regulator [Methanomicrobiales archaeon]